MSQSGMVETWKRNNVSLLSNLGGPQNDIAGLFVRLGCEELLRHRDLGIWDDVTLSEDDSAMLRDRGRALADVARDLQQNLHPIPDPPAQDLLTQALAEYVRAGDLISAGGDTDVLAGFSAWLEAAEAFERFAERVVEAAK